MFCYIHIPFCESKCNFCRFASIGSVNQILVKRYLAHLKNDIKTSPFWASYKAQNVLESVYFWWGTPSTLSHDQLWEILDELKWKFWFQNNIEITLETTPQKVNPSSLHQWKQLGINRISMWVQTLNNQTLKTTTREDNTSIFQALEAFNASPIENISLDFIIGLPYVQPWETLKDIQTCLRKAPNISHISVYMLEDYFEPNTQDSSKFEQLSYTQEYQYGIPENEYESEYLSIVSFLEENWFHQYELSNFSKAGYKCKHNQAYWTHQEMMAFWLGAHGYKNRVRFGYKDDFIGYFNKEFAYKETLSQEQIQIEKIMFWLRTRGIEKEMLSSLHQENISKYQTLWLLEIKDTLLKTTPKGKLMIDTILSDILA